MANPVCATILNRLPDRLFSEALAGMNRDIEVLALNIMKSIHVLLRRKATLLACEVEAYDSTRPKVNRKLRHLERDVHVPHRADDQTRLNAELLSSASHAL